MKLVRTDANVPIEDMPTHWVVEGIIEPGVRKIVLFHRGNDPKVAIDKAHELFGDRHSPLFVYPNYIQTGKIFPAYVERW